MLNCCIERKRARDEARKVVEGSEKREHRMSSGHQNSRSVPESATVMTAGSISAKEVSPGKSWDSWSDSEDEFFECLSDQGEIEAPPTDEEKEGNKSKAEGRLHPYNNMTLLNSTEPLYVPITQVNMSLFLSFRLTHSHRFLVCPNKYVFIHTSWCKMYSSTNHS